MFSPRRAGLAPVPETLQLTHTDKTTMFASEIPRSARQSHPDIKHETHAYVHEQGMGCVACGGGTKAQKRAPSLRGPHLTYMYSRRCNGPTRSRR